MQSEENPLTLEVTDSTRPQLIIEQKANPDGSYLLGPSHWTAMTFSLDKLDFNVISMFPHIIIKHDQHTYDLYNVIIKLLKCNIDTYHYVAVFDTAKLSS